MSAVLLVAVSSTNGYLTLAFYDKAAKRMDRRHKKYTGFVMTVSLGMGLFYGSLVSYLSVVG
jgi:hypothetical protein